MFPWAEGGLSPSFLPAFGFSSIDFPNCRTYILKIQVLSFWTKVLTKSADSIKQVNNVHANNLIFLSMRTIWKHRTSSMAEEGQILAAVMW